MNPAICIVPWAQLKHAVYGEIKVEQDLVTNTGVFLSVFGG